MTALAIPHEIARAFRGGRFYPTADVLAKTPPLYGTENMGNAETIIVAHYFTGSSDWWIAEIDQETWEAFGYARLNGDDQNAEWGYVDLTELERIYVRGRMGGALPVIVERDMHRTPKTATDCGITR